MHVCANESAYENLHSFEKSSFQYVNIRTKVKFGCNLSE